MTLALIRFDCSCGKNIQICRDRQMERERERDSLRVSTYTLQCVQRPAARLDTSPSMLAVHVIIEYITKGENIAVVSIAVVIITLRCIMNRRGWHRCYNRPNEREVYLEWLVLHYRRAQRCPAAAATETTGCWRPASEYTYWQPSSFSASSLSSSTSLISCVDALTSPVT